MFNERHIQPGVSREGDLESFLEKRLAPWIREVPERIRRQEYELWKRYKGIFFAKQFQSRSVANVEPPPPFSETVEAEYWEKFRQSFLEGEKRDAEFKEKIALCSAHSDQFIENITNQTGQDFESEILMVAMGGSAFYGPRTPGSFLSDTDLYFLVNDDTNTSNFEIFPTVEDQFMVHIIGTGYSDKSRLQREQIHWLLCPYYPLRSKLADGELKEITDNLIRATDQREQEISAEIERLEEMMDRARHGERLSQQYS